MKEKKFIARFTDKHGKVHDVDIREEDIKDIVDAVEMQCYILRGDFEIDGSYFEKVEIYGGVA